ncbi:MAG: hypothetical protein ACQEP8_03765 [Chlamydiota bacterium]
MPTTENISAEQESTQLKKYTKLLAIFFTTVYAVLFPLFLYASSSYVVVFDDPKITLPIGVMMIITGLLLPLSMPVSIYFIWSKYLRKQYEKVRLFCALPIATYFIIDFLMTFQSIYVFTR